MDDLSIVVLNHNGKEVLNKCLDCIFRNVLPNNCQVAVLDNRSTDKSAKKAEKLYDVDIIEGTNEHGFITGLNTAFEKALHPNVFFISNDVFLEPSAVHNMVIALETFPDSILQPVFYWPDGSVQNAGMKWYWPGYGYADKQGGSIHTFYVPTIVTTTAIMMTRKTFYDIGPFDTAFAPAHYEDVDYSFRAKKKGHRLLVVGWARAMHLASHTISKQDGDHGTSDRCHRNRLYLIDKHYKGIDKTLRKAAVHVLDRAGRLIGMR